MSERPRIAITIGDANGVGIEVMIKALYAPSVRASSRPLIVGSSRVIDEYLQAGSLLGARVVDGELEVGGERVPIVEIESDAHVEFGRATPEMGRLAGMAIERATRLVIAAEATAMVTMPISKASLQSGGYDFPGHTEMIASICGGTPMMILMTKGMRVALATIHIPIANVATTITRELVADRIEQLERSLRVDFGIAHPSIAVLALNPHAGEEGRIGGEEIESIGPAVRDARMRGTDAIGPLPADGYFARFVPGEHDGILAMYHDQGLIPLKLYARGAGVNFTANLPIVRTSPDHGTAYAITGHGIADATSTIEAIEVAVDVARRRAEAGSQPVAGSQ